MMDFHPDRETLPQAERILANNSALMDNSVYSFAPGRRNSLWIGTEDGLNYYSYLTRRIEEFPVIADGKKVKYVHSICAVSYTHLDVYKRQFLFCMCVCVNHTANQKKQT